VSLIESGTPRRYVPAVLRFLLTRHGQSEWNAAGRWQGQADPGLSEVGRRQAGLAATRLGSVDAIVASDLERAQHTATIISDLLGVGPVLVEGDLRERDAGEWSGLTKAEIERDWPGYLADRHRPPGFEDEEPFLDRVLAGIGRIHQRLGGGDVLAVTHGGVIYAIERHLGAGFERIPNLGARWIIDYGDSLELGDRLVLIDPEDATVPDQL
jgi:probable phosphoglycerate mutase